MAVGECKNRILRVQTGSASAPMMRTPETTGMRFRGNVLYRAGGEPIADDLVVESLYQMESAGTG